MPDETIFCPQCQAKVKVPESLLGQAVTCPMCRHTFTAPIRGGGSIAPPAPVPYVTPVHPDAASAVRTPAMVLLAIGVLGLAMNLFNLANTFALGPEGLAAQTQEILQKLGLPMQAGDPSQAYVVSLLITGLFVAFTLVVILGAWQMLRLRAYGLAIAACILAALNLGSCCCLLGLPAGIWALTVLQRPEVKAAFH